MAKFPSPLLGYNNNVRHKGRVFHIQTEDSGINHPHIITHLFMDGGRILKSVKTSYAEHVGNDGMGDKVRAMMKDQHKAMFIALRDGQFDEAAFGKKPAAEDKSGLPSGVLPPDSESPIVTVDSGPELPPSSPELVHVPDSTSAIASDGATVNAKTELAIPVPPSTRAPGRAEPPPPSPPSARAPRATEQPPPTDRSAAPPFADRPRDDSSVEVIIGVTEVDLVEAGVGVPSIDEELRRPPSPPPPSEPRTERRGPSASELTLDFDALERDTDVSVSALYQSADLPPPPKNLLAGGRKDLGTGKYKNHEPPPVSEAPPSSRRGATPTAPPAAARPAAESRYAPARPAAIFGAPAAKPAPPASIFGDDLVGDKSLDEVILSYLAEDLDPPPRRK